MNHSRLAIENFIPYETYKINPSLGEVKNSNRFINMDIVFQNLIQMGMGYIFMVKLLLVNCYYGRKWGTITSKKHRGYLLTHLFPLFQHVLPERLRLSA